MFQYISRRAYAAICQVGLLRVPSTNFGTDTKILPGIRLVRNLQARRKYICRDQRLQNTEYVIYHILLVRVCKARITKSTITRQDGRGCEHDATGSNTTLVLLLQIGTMRFASEMYIYIYTAVNDCQARCTPYTAYSCIYRVLLACDAHARYI